MDSPKGPRPKNSPPDCFLNGLSVGTTAGASFTNSIVIETLVIDYELNSKTKRKSRSFDLLFFLAPQVGLAAAGGAHCYATCLPIRADGLAATP